MSDSDPSPRQRAEVLAAALAAADTRLPPDAAPKLLHELRVHQIELEMQNEHLRQAQAELAASQALYVDLYDRAPVGYCTLDADGLMLQANLTAASRLGLARSELVGQRLTRFIQPEDQDGWYFRTKALVERGEPLACELRMKRADGLPFWAQLTASVAAGGGGEVLLRVVIDDISAVKGVELELQKYRLAVEQSPESIAITDVRGRIEYVNQAFVQRSGYSRAEAAGQHPLRLLGAAAHLTPEQRRTLRRALASGQSWRGELDNRRKDGSAYVESALITPLRQADGRVSHHVTLQTDITERKRLNAELERHRLDLEGLVHSRTAELVDARAQAEEANRAKSNFLAHMSHEIRTPMNAIIGLNDLLRRAGVTPEQQQRLDQIDSASRHLLDVVNDILDVSKIEAGQVRLEAIDFELSTLFDPVVAIIGEAAQKKGLRFTVDTGTVPRWLCGDPTRLRQALLNYASNAIKFTASGSITLNVRLLDDSAGALRLRFAVEDTGIGVDASAAQRLFHAFEQADVSTTRHYGGTGLGLAITHRLAELMGGEAGVDSVPGAGSSFWFTAVLQRGHGQPPDPQAAVPADPLLDAEAQLRRDHGGARVLLADDNEFNRSILQEMLELAGLTVVAVADGLQAVEQARAARFDLVLTDMQMPGLDGIGAARLMRSLPGWSAVPIIALTANNFEEGRRACMAAGMNDFIVKPVALHRLCATLLHWLQPGASGPAPAGDR